MVGWTVIPFISWFMHEGLSHGRMALTHAVNLVAVLALVGWARESLSKTGLNRRVAANLVVVSVALLVGDLGGWVLGVDPLTTVIFHHLVFAALCGAAVEGVDPRTGLLAALYLAVFAVGAWRPELILPLGALANLVVALAAFALWAPAARGRLFTRLPEGALGADPRPRGGRVATAGGGGRHAGRSATLAADLAGLAGAGGTGLGGRAAASAGPGRRPQRRPGRRQRQERPRSLRASRC